MASIPSRAQRPLLSFPGLLWAGSWGVMALAFAFAGDFLLFAVFLSVAILGWVPFTREGPNFLVVARWLYHKWKMWRLGTTYRREISSTQMIRQRGVGPLKGLFKVEIVLLQFKSLKDVFLQFPALLNGKRHTIMVEAGSNPVAAMADDEETEVLIEREADLYADLAQELGNGSSFTIWSLHRRADRSAEPLYLEERGDPDIVNETTDEYSRKLEEHLDSTDEITAGNLTRRRGFSLTATNPSSWKARKLNKLTAEQLQESPAVRAALMLEEKAEGIGIEAAVCSFPAFQRILREVFSVNNLDLPRERALRDIVHEKAASVRNEVIDPATLYSADETPLPTMQRELANNYMIFDGTYHRVMWITDYLSTGGYDHLHTAECDYFASVYCDIWPAELDDSRRQDKGKLGREFLEMTKRNITAHDEQNLESLDSERYDAVQYGNYVVYLRTLVIVSGKSLEAMERSQSLLISHLARRNVRVKMHVVTGPDQLEWFFAALGSFGVKR